MKLKITVHGVAYEVDVEVLDTGDGFPTTPPPRPRQRPAGGNQTAPPPRPQSSSPSGTASGMVTSPIAGTVIELKCKPGDKVEKNQILLIIEAMKMKTSIAAPTAGTVKSVPVAVGDSVRENQTLVEFE